MTANLYADIRRHVVGALQTLQAEGSLPGGLSFDAITVEQPKDPSHGDLATNAAMVLAKPAGTNPRQLADKLVALLGKQAGIRTAAVAGPGFINLSLDTTAYAATVRAILAAGPKVGEGAKKNEKIMVEFVSANPTGPMHVGHGRGAVFGDVLCRLLQKAGYTVGREYLINDAGAQVKTFAKSVWLRYRELFGEAITLPEGCYPGEYVIDVAKTLKAKDGDRWLKATEDEVVPGIRAFVVDEMMKVIKDDLTALGVPFDTFFSEYAMHDSGRTKKAVEVLRAKGYVYEGVLEAPKGKTPDDWEPVELTLFKSTAFGDDVDRPLYKSDGSFTYFGADVAYHQIKLERGFDRLINVWGADHGGTVKRVQAAIEALTGRKGALDVKLMQMVKLTRGGQPVKMSKRAGNFVTLREVVDEVGADAIRFWFLSRREDSQLDFDLQKAVEKNNDNPVFYAQYAHARMCAVYRQAQEQGIAMPDAAKADLNLLTHPAEQALMRVLAAWPHTVERAADAAEPHRLVFYAGELAAAFHSWYNAERFLHADNLPLTHARLILVEASRIVLRSVFEVISVSAPERM